MPTTFTFKKGRAMRISFVSFAVVLCGLALSLPCAIADDKPAADKPDAVRPEAAAQIEAVIQEAKKLKEAGRHEEALELHRKAETLARELKQRQGERADRVREEVRERSAEVREQAAESRERAALRSRDAGREGAEQRAR